MDALHEKHCAVCESGGEALPKAQADTLLSNLDGWTVNPENTAIERTFHFKTFSKTMAFANAVAWIAHSEGHHPEWHIGYDKCTISYTTHAVNGLTENDFICAARVDRLIAQ